jgi:hypothetical protein
MAKTVDSYVDGATAKIHPRSFAYMRRSALGREALSPALPGQARLRHHRITGIPTPE